MLFVLIHLITGTVLAGVLMTAVLATPTLMEMGHLLLPAAAVAGFIGAMPISYVVARALQRPAADAQR